MRSLNFLGFLKYHLVYQFYFERSRRRFCLFHKKDIRRAARVTIATRLSRGTIPSQQFQEFTTQLSGNTGQARGVSGRARLATSPF